MSETLNDTKIHSSAVSDRGLNERRPLNEDSFLADEGRHIFATLTVVLAAADVVNPIHLG